MAGMRKRQDPNGAWQADLFDPSAGPGGGIGRPGKAPVPPATVDARSTVLDEEDMARRLEASGRYRILRQLVPRPVVGTGEGGATGRIGLILDTETTGLDHRSDEIIELGMVAFTYDENGIGDVIGVFSQMRQPSVPISLEITGLTGITDAMVEGRSIDPDAVSAFVAPADLVIAHNARFDRPFCERLHDAFKEKAWACSVAEVDWQALGFEGSKLVYLIAQCGLFHTGHRAIDDCHALLEVMAAPSATNAAAPFVQLLRSCGKERLRIYARGSPFETKDCLKARGYVWNDGTDGNPKSWWIEVEDDAFDEELSFLRETIYRSTTKPVVQRLSAWDRYRA
ncbi:3'-5' exonuclease [Fulvimarina sp. 2208YS6-2-32]|uniref:3'-5' exonuclease n=1 Tax=Fulvimarina uroteuthidis TaxID=3098149 RepID=A0ABU5I7C9_9HYPH|nr:3'-5' exonuclease [Fulvimarina sp. 2208YS6-2-32]MDY8110838.1 3'-5' exonuclease [Fulvimarina sp. 2208YS6-2-32]